MVVEWLTDWGLVRIPKELTKSVSDLQVTGSFDDVSIYHRIGPMVFRM